MDDLELCNIIEQNVESGIGGDDGDLSETRRTIYDRYMGELYGDEKDGQSKITTREVFETVEWAMPSIIRVFESGDRVVEFDPVGPEDEQGAEQETDAVNHVYQKDNNGFITTHNIVKSALINPNSYVKVYRDEREEATTEQYSYLNDQEAMLLLNDQDVEVVGQEITEQGFNLEIKRTTSRGKTLVKPIPEEEIIIHQNHSELSLEECEFVCHKPQKSYSELLQLGYDAAKLDLIEPDYNLSSEESNRKTYSGEGNIDDETQKALRKYTVYECTMLLDWDDDGIAERRHIVKIGNEIFENKEIDYMPIESSATIIMPHKHTGYSLAQSILDLQDLKTYFMRQTVNNMGRMNNPRTFINENVNLADALSDRTNGFIRVEGDPRAQASVEPIQPIIGQVLPLMDLIDNQKEGRSGITRNSMGLDADILAKSTEGAFMGAIEKAEQRVEFIVRVLAETVFKSIFLKVHHLLQAYGDTKYMRLNGQWVLVNPSEWKKRESMTCNVGLGLGSRDQKMMAARVIIAEQDKAMQMGIGLVDPQKVYNSRRLLVESVGEKNVDKYFSNPAINPPPPPPPPAPDPNMMMIQANAQIEAAKNQTKQMEIMQKSKIEAAQLQFNQAKAASEQRFDQIELAYKREIENLKANNDAGSKAMSAKIDQLEMKLKSAQEDEKIAMDKYKADLDAATKMSLKRMDITGESETNELIYKQEVENVRQAVIDAGLDNQINHETLNASIRDIAESRAGIEKSQKSIENVNKSLTDMARIIADMQQPKEIVRDKDGNPVGVRNVTTGEVRRIIKDDEGLPVGIE